MYEDKFVFEGQEYDGKGVRGLIADIENQGLYILAYMAEKTYVCTDCNELIHDSDPHAVWNNSEHFCLNCALKRGIIGPLYWLDTCGIGIYHHATYNNGTITGFQKWGRGYRKDEIKIE